MSFLYGAESIHKKIYLVTKSIRIILSLLFALISQDLLAKTETVTVDFSQPITIIPSSYPNSAGTIFIDDYHQIFLTGYGPNGCQIENGKLVLFSFSPYTNIYNSCGLSFSPGTIAVSGVVSGTYEYPFVEGWPLNKLHLDISTYNGLSGGFFGDVAPFFALPFSWSPPEGANISQIWASLDSIIGNVDGHVGLNSITWEVFISDPLNLWAFKPRASQPDSVVYTPDGYWQFTPGESMDIVVPVGGRGIRTTENRSTTVTLRAGSQPTQSKTYTLQEIKATEAAGSMLMVPFTVTFGPEDIGLQTIIATINPDNVLEEEDYSNNIEFTRIRVQSSNSGYKIVSTTLSPSHIEEKKVQGDVPVKAQYALGSVFDINLEKLGSDGLYRPWKGKFELVGAPSFDNPGAIDPNESLFENNSVILFDKASSGFSKKLQGVHLGKSTLRITPDPDAQGRQDKAIIVEVRIIRPTTLGLSDICKAIGPNGEQRCFDDAIIKFADKRGIPPQIIKSHIRRESGFKWFYRYEPITVDYLLFTGKKPKSDPRGRSPYSDYILPTVDRLINLPVGPILDKHRETVLGPRLNSFYIPTDVTNDFVTAEEIFTDFDSVWNWKKSFDPGIFDLSGNDRSSNIYFDLAIRKTDLLRFSAQTPVASSYGFLHVLYSTAVDLMRWRGVTDQSEDNMSPSNLFDVEDGIWDRGGGSMSIGTRYLLVKFVDNNDIESENPDLKDPVELSNAFYKALSAYNNPRSKGNKYGEDVMIYSEEFLPVSNVQIFP